MAHRKPRSSPPIEAILLRSNNPAHRVTTGQDDAAMIDLRRRAGGLVERGHCFLLNQCTTAGGTPVGSDLQIEHGVALSANASHNKRLTDWGGLFRKGLRLRPALHCL